MADTDLRDIGKSLAETLISNETPRSSLSINDYTDIGNQLSRQLFGPEEQTPAPKPKTQTKADSNPLVDLGKGLVKGTVYGIPHLLSQSAEFLGIGGETVKNISKWAEEGLGNEEKGVFETTGEMIPSSVGIAGGAMALGRIISLIPHPYAKIAGTALSLGGQYLTPALFGLSQAQETKKTAEEKGMDPGMAPYATGTIEWLGETAANWALGRVLGPLAGPISKSAKKTISKMTAAESLKGSLASYLKELAVVTLPTEVSTEILQNWGEALVEKKAGIRPEADPLAEGASAIAPTALMTAILGPFARVAHIQIANRQADLLSKPVDSKNPNFKDTVKARLLVAAGVKNIIPEENKALRDQWSMYAGDKIARNEAIDIAAQLDTLKVADNAVSKDNKTSVLRSMGMKPPTAVPTADQAPMTNSTVESKTIVTEGQRQVILDEAKANNLKVTRENKTLFDAVANEDLGQQQELETARIEENARRDAETARLASQETAQTDNAVAEAQSQGTELKTSLAGADVRKQTIVDDVLNLTEKRLLTAAQKENGLTIVPAGPGIYTIETAEGPLPVSLLQIRQRLAVKRIEILDAKDARERADEEAMRQTAVETAIKKAKKDAESSLENARLFLSTNSLSPGMRQILDENRQQLTEQEIARLDKPAGSPSAAVAITTGLKNNQIPLNPPLIKGEEQVKVNDTLSEKENPDYRTPLETTTSLTGQADKFLVSTMLSDLDNSSKGQLVHDAATGTSKRLGAGIVWLTDVNKGGLDVSRADARTVLTKVQTNETLTPRQQTIYDAITAAAMKRGGNVMAQNISWAEKGFFPVPDKKIEVNDLVEGDRFVIAGEEFKVTNIDEKGNVTMKDGTIRQVKEGTVIKYVDFIKQAEEAGKFNPDELAPETETKPAPKGDFSTRAQELNKLADKFKNYEIPVISEATFKKAFPSPAETIKADSVAEAASVALPTGLKKETKNLSDEQIIDSYLEGKTPAAEKDEQQQLILTGGPAGAGKSTAIPRTGLENVVVANSDKIGTTIGAGKKTPAIHERASALTKKLLTSAIKGGYDTLYDSQLTNFPLADDAIQNVLRNNGQVIIGFTNIDAETSIVRSETRQTAAEEKLGENDNREVPREVSIKGHNAALATFHALFQKYKENPNVSMTMIDNNVDFQKPIDVFKQSAGELNISDQKLFDKFMNEEYINYKTKEGTRYERKNKIAEKDLANAGIEARKDVLLNSKRDARRAADTAPTQEKAIKEADHDTLGSRKSDNQQTQNDQAGAQRQGALDLQAIANGGETAGVLEGSRRGNDGELRERGSGRSTSPAGTEGLPGEPAKSDQGQKPRLGRNAGNVSRIRRPRRGTDHVIEPGSIERKGSWLNTAKNNLDIIELVKKLDTEGRLATPEEQKILAQYTGFGASEIANNIFPNYARDGEVKPYFAKDKNWQNLAQRLVDNLTPEEIASAARSTQYAHYTSPAIISSIYKAMDRFGFPGGKVLEPGMGVGSFFGLMPEKMRNLSVYTGIENDPVTAKIAKHLYQNQNIIEGDYTKQKLPNDFFDVGIGNFPFSSTKILTDPDYKKLRLPLHDYFTVKSLDKVRPGGLMVFITSHFTMDKQNDRMRQILNDKADLMGAIRLPQTAFKQNAGTEVVTDVLFLRKKIPGEITEGQSWANLTPVATPEGDFSINEYFARNPEMILGKNSGKGKMYGRTEPGYTVLPPAGNIEDHFAQAIEKLPQNVYSTMQATPQEQAQAVIESDFNPANKKEGGLYVSDKGEVMVTEYGRGVPLTSRNSKYTAADKRWFTDYVALRDAVKMNQHDQLNDRDWEKSLEALKHQYAMFVLAYGRINDFKVYERKTTDEDGNEQITEYRRFKNEQRLREDVESPLVEALEQITEDNRIVEGPFLQGRTIKKPEPPQIKTVPDALAVSLNETGRLDLDHVARLIDQPLPAVIEQLGDLIYDTPDKGYLLADEYLSGNVVEKLAAAKAAAAIDPKYDRNVQALTKAQPPPLSSKDITVNPGATWIPLTHYDDFAHEVLGLNHVQIRHTLADNSWTVEGGRQQSHRGAAHEWGTPERGANELLQSILNNATIKVSKTIFVDGQRKSFVDTAATAAANEVAKKMRARFKTWVWEDANRARELLDIYNSSRNTIVPRRFDGSHLTLPGVSLRFNLMPHQKDAIWRVIQDGNTYIAHAVGAGKTYEMVAAGMEMKRLSLIKKPLYVVPNHMLQQFANEFQDLYPMAHIMVADEENFHTLNRKRFMAQASLNNPDAIIITHSAAGLLKMKEENIKPVRDEILDELRASLDDLEDDKTNNRIKIKQMEKRIEQVEQRFDSMTASGDNVVSFEDMGVDFLFVDEAHQFRKLDFTTNRQAKGIDPNGSRRAMDLYIKTKWLDKEKPGRSHVFASGTPVTNTMGELYTVMKFFMENQMDKEGIHYFDSWANEYGEMASVPEMNAAGRYEIVERFSKFVNMPEMMSRVRSFMDVLTASQLGGFVSRPTMKGGQPEIVVTPPSPALKNYQDKVLQPRIQKSKDWKPSPQEKGNPDPMINIITDGRLASIDLRFVKSAENDPSSKLNVFIDKIIELHKATKDTVYLDPASGKEAPLKGGAIIAFYNHGFGKMVAQNRGFDARAWAMKQFKDAGIKASEVAWIDNYDTAAKKEAMFKEVRTGAKRIMLGSAKKMGTGMNVQNRLANLVYLDAPWYPADVEQPLGRIVRQGNQNKEVGAYYFATKGSYDATMWQMVTRKSKFVEDAFSGGTTRSIEDISETSLYEMAAALASGDERAIKLAGLNADINNLENLRSAHYSAQRQLNLDQRETENKQNYLSIRLAHLKEAEEKIPDYIGHDISGKVDKKSFTERKPFAETLIAKMVALTKEGKEGKTQVGEISGLTLIAALTKTGDTIFATGTQKTTTPGKIVNQLIVRITDKIAYEVSTDITENSDPTGLASRIANRVNGVQADLSQVEHEITARETEIKKINARLGAPFEFAQELHEKIAEAAQINTALTEESKANTAAAAPTTGTKEPENIPDKIKEFYTPENIVFDSYWKAYDKVLDFKINKDGWQVQVIRVDKDGNAIKGEEPRWHSTAPGKGDRVISKNNTLDEGTKLSIEPAQRLGDVQLNELVRGLSALIKGTEVIEKDGELWIKTKSGDEVRIVSAEAINPQRVSLTIDKHYAQEKMAGKRIAGMFQPGEPSTIHLVQDVAGIWTLSHEFYHFLEDIGAISNADKILLNNKINSLIKKDPETYGYLKDRSNPEQRAEWVGRTLVGVYDPQTPTGKLIARIKEIIDKIINAIGIRTAAGVVRDIKSGAVYEKLFDSAAEKGVKSNYDIQDAKRENIIAENQTAEDQRTISNTGRTNTYPEVISEKSGIYKAAKTKITSTDDLATLANANIGNKAQENFISVVTDKNGKILSVYRHTVGLANSAQANPSLIVGQALNNPTATKIWLAHNHPSGGYEFSREDIKVRGEIENLLKGTRINLGDFIAVGDGKYDSWNGIQSIIGTEGTKKIAVSERVFTTKGNQKAVKNEQDLTNFAKDNNVDGIILLNSLSQPVGVIEGTDFSEIRGNKQEQLLKEIEKRNAAGMAAVRLDGNISGDELGNLRRFAAATGLDFIDSIDKNGSLQAQGLSLKTNDKTFYSLEDMTDKATAAAGKKVSRAVDMLTGKISPERREVLGALKKQWKEFWKPFSTVKNGDEVLARRYESMGNVAKAVHFIEAIKTELDTFPDAVKKDMFWYLNGDIPLESLPEDAREIAKNIQRRTEIIGEMLVDRGILTQETFEKHKGQYIHYMYAKHIVGEDAPVGITSSGKLDLSYTLQRNPNLTTLQRKELGLIEDASVAVPVGMGKALTDIAKFDYLKTIAENPDWVWQPSVVNIPIGKPLAKAIHGRTRRYVMMGAGHLVDEVKVYDEMMRTQPSPAVSAIHQTLITALNKAQKATENAPADFVQLPNTRGYGPLAGAFVVKPIADDLRPVMDVNTDRGKLLNTIVSIERQGMAAFKMGKVALNFPTAVRNTISNIIQINMSGRNLAQIPGDMIKAAESVKAEDQYYKEARSMGLFNTNWFATEINDVLQEFRHAESGRIDKVVTAVKNVAKYYGKIDDFFKLALYRQQRETGQSIDQATIYAMKWGMDYSLTSRSIKGLRQTIVPFATYQYKIAPLIAESIKKRPWVLAKYALIYPMAKMLAMGLHGLDDDDWDDLIKQLPAYIKKSGSMMILPWKTDKGQWQWVNLEYFFPWGNYLGMFRDVKEKDSGELLRDAGIGNPFLSMFFTGLSARNDQPPIHSYFGTPIYNELDPAPVKAAKYLEYMVNTWMPSMLTRQGALGYAGKLIMGNEDRWGRAVNLPQALGRWFGVNIVSVSPEQSRAQVSVQVQELHKEMARIEADPSRSAEEKAAYRQRMNEKVGEIAQEAPAAILPITKAKGHDVVYEALKAMAAKGILHTAPPSLSVEISGIPMKMSMDQYKEYLATSSEIARRKLEVLVTSPAWETMPDYRKGIVVEHIVANARKSIRQKIKGEILRDNRDKILEERLKRQQKIS